MLRIAYETYGKPNAARSNIIVITHGATSSHVAAGEVTPDRRKGWWDEIIGPGRLFDTEKYCIVSSNMLGSSYGSTGPSSPDPRTGRPYGPDFPDITFSDIVDAQYRLLRYMNVEKLVAVAGSSLGGYQAFQWAVTYPDYMSCVLALDTAPRDLFDSTKAASELLAELSKHPNWNGGHNYETSGLEDVLTDIRIPTLRSYGFEEQLDGIVDREARNATLIQVARDWAQEFDANSLVTLRRAMGTFNVEVDLHKIRTRLLYVLADSDEWFPASIGHQVMANLKSAGVDAEFVELHSPYGHYATTRQPEKWVKHAARLLHQ